MRLVGFGVLVALALYATTSGLLSAALGVGWRALRARLAGASADLLLGLRLLPSLGALLVVFGLFVPAYLRHEPWRSDERAGPALALLGCVGLGLVGAGIARARRALRVTEALRSRWKRAARPLAPAAGVPVFRIAEAFPLACVVGLWRQELFVADSLLQALEPEQLSAVLAHESHHARRRDNLKALLVRAAPDWLAMSAAGHQIEAAWRRAAESEADAAASASSRSRALSLASALVRLARIAPAERPAFLAASFFDRSPVEERVLRLVKGPASTGAARLARILAALAALASAATLAWGLTSLERVHAAAEAALALLR